tara:strand:+ start:346 stop:657 length:312 start_codon:yes stop_codon:yes gene_type:complete
MAVRVKQTVLDIAYKHFKEFELPLDIEYKAYTNIVGAKEALSPPSVKRSFKAWKYLLHALKKHHPDLGKKPEPAPAPKPAPKAKVAPATPSSEAAPAEEKSED